MAKRGTRFNDTLGRTVWLRSELRDISEIEVTPLTYLAMMLFLSRHADCRAYLFVQVGPDDRCKKVG